MKRICMLCVSLLLFSIVFAQPEAALVKAVKAKLDKVQNYQANGKMKIDVSFIKAPESDVVVYYKRPNKFAVTKPNGISILPKGGVSININSLLLTDNYTVVPSGTATVKGTITKVVKLLPGDANSDVVLTTLYIDEKAQLIRKTSVTTKDNGTYEMELDYGKYAAWGLPDHVVFLFNTKEYKLPKGITFEYEKGGAPKQPTANNNTGKVSIDYSSYSINKGVSDKMFQK